MSEQRIDGYARALFEVARADLASFENTGRSLMPEGFDGLGAENLRNLLSYMCAEEGRYRILDLKDVASADTRRGLFANINTTEDTFTFRKLGLIQHEGVLFEILDPARTPTGRLRNTKHNTITKPVPVSSTGGTLKARM